MGGVMMMGTKEKEREREREKKKTNNKTRGIDDSFSNPCHRQRPF
jgi:hypothetical protein